MADGLRHRCTDAVVLRSALSLAFSAQDLAGTRPRHCIACYENQTPYLQDARLKPRQNSPCRKGWPATARRGEGTARTGHTGAA